MNIFLDYDCSKQYFTYVPRSEIWETNLELIEFEAHRLKHLFPQLGRIAIIRKSSLKGNYHLLFTDANVENWEQAEQIMLTSKGHKGHIRYSMAFQDSTIRVGRKKTAEAPYTVKIIRFEE